MPTLSPATASTGTEVAASASTGTASAAAAGSGALVAAAIEAIGGPIYPLETLFPSDTLYPSDDTRGFTAVTPASGTLVPA